MTEHLHRPERPSGDGLVPTHGAGGSAGAPLLVALADALAAAGLTVLRYDLPYRQASRTAPPRPGGAAKDREGLRSAMASMRARATGRIFLGGQSYGGRQASMLAASEPGLADALLLLSYPLHPPQRPAELRTAHLPDLRTPAMFAHGSRDLFGTLEEIEAAGVPPVPHRPLGSGTREEAFAAARWGTTGGSGTAPPILVNRDRARARSASCRAPGAPRPGRGARGRARSAPG